MYYFEEKKKQKTKKLNFGVPLPPYWQYYWILFDWLYMNGLCSSGLLISLLVQSTDTSHHQSLTTWLIGLFVTYVSYLTWCLRIVQICGLMMELQKHVTLVSKYCCLFLVASFVGDTLTKEEGISSTCHKCSAIMTEDFWPFHSVLVPLVPSIDIWLHHQWQSNQCVYFQMETGENTILHLCIFWSCLNVKVGQV